jgi:hypothetical protein
MQADYLDGHMEEEEHENLKAAMEAAAAAVGRGATEVRVFPIPHDFAGTGHRCAMCGRKRHDQWHSGVVPRFP